MSMMVFNIFKASSLGLWKLLRPMIEPKPPPAWMPRISS